METKDDAKSNISSDKKNEEGSESKTTDKEGNDSKNRSQSEGSRKSEADCPGNSSDSPDHNAGSSKITAETDIEGGGQENVKEPVGPTLAQHEYNRAREDYDQISKNLRENAMKTMIKMLELQASLKPQNTAASTQASQSPNLQFNKMSNPLVADSINSGNSSLKPNDVTEKDVETQVRELEKKMKTAISRIAESKREQAYLLSLINNLEVKMYRTEEVEYIKEIMSRVPQEGDLEKMKRLQESMLERKCREREIQRLQMEIRAMNNAMANADVIISESAPIKKPRKVVIRTESTVQDSPTCSGLIDTEYPPAKHDWPNIRNTPSPEQELEASSAESLGSSNADTNGPGEERTQPEDIGEGGEIKEGDAKAVPPTKNKKSKK